MKERLGLQIKILEISKKKHLSVNRISSSLLYVRRLVYISIMTALLIVGAKITINFGVVPFTLQTVCVGILAYILGPIWGGVTTIIYLLLGAAGLPVFSGGGGIAKLIGPTGGFIIGFTPMAIIIGFSKKINSDIIQILLGVVALIVLYIFGAVVFAKGLPDKSFEGTMKWLISTFGLKDLASIILAQVIAKKIKERLGDSLIIDESDQ